MMAWVSMGHRYTLVLASHVKRILQGELPPQWRLEFLNHLEKMVDSVLTADIIALVEPMDDEGAELLEEARKLGYDPRGPNMFNVLDQKFDIFAALNPSLQRACDAACQPWSKSA
jgi:hypothetical protein